MTASITLKPQKSIPEPIPKPEFGFAAAGRGKTSSRNRNQSISGVERRSLLLELLPYHPYKVLSVVFETASHHEMLVQQLSRWLNVCTLNATQAGFYDALPLLIEALNRINEQKQRSRSEETGTIASVIEPDTRTPFDFLRDFFQRYPQDYVRRELARCLHVVLNYAYDHRDIPPATVFDWYEQVHSLVEAASILSLPRGLNGISKD